MEVHGVGTQDEHFIPTPNEWTNLEGELGDAIIFKELCGDESTRLGGPFRDGRVLLQQFGAFDNGGHPLSNGDGLSQPYLGMKFTFPKLGLGSPSRLLKLQSSITGVKTPCIRVFFIP